MCLSRPKPVLNKRDFQRRFSDGEFGNRGPLWNTPEELTRAYVSGEFDGPVHLRNRKRASDKTYYDLSPQKAGYWWRVMPKPSDWFVAAMAPTKKTLFQGEVYLNHNGLELRYSTVVATMREALATRQEHAHGIMAVCLLRTYMDPSSYDWLQELIDKYPNHVIEFSVYSVNWGTIPNRNTIFWECRRY